jgi:DNA-directed RNA polymerase I, II, and III subunit RPABC2
MSDIGERLEDPIDDVEINLTEDEALSDADEEEILKEEEKEEIPDVVNEVNNSIIIEDYRDMLTQIHQQKNKRTLPFITKYEKARILGIRAQQLATGSIPLVPVRGMTSTIQIAEEEYLQKKIPFIIKRVLPDNVIEYWTIDELMIR